NLNRNDDRLNLLLYPGVQEPTVSTVHGWQDSYGQWNSLVTPYPPSEVEVFRREEAVGVEPLRGVTEGRLLLPHRFCSALLSKKQSLREEKYGFLHGNGMPGWGQPRPNAYLGNGGAGFVLGVPRLGIPMIQMSDAAYGVRSSGENGRYSTALPSDVAAAASWDVHAACAYGALIGRELRAQGYNMTLGGGVNLTREPRNGRTFEYMGEDQILAGTLVGNRMKCEQAQHL